MEILSEIIHRTNFRVYLTMINLILRAQQVRLFEFIIGLRY